MIKKTKNKKDFIKKVNLRKVILSSILYKKSELRKEKISIKLDLNKEIDFMIDEGDLIQVLTNILSNSKEALVDKKENKEIITIYTLFIYQT